MAYKQPSSGSSFKMMGSTPAKNAGIFDYQGNRISTKRADEIEKNKETGWNQIKYTEGDAVKKASEEADKAITPKDKSKWLKEASEQSKTMSERMTNETKIYPSQKKTTGELYMEKHNLDQKLQEQIEEGTYKKEDEPKGFKDDYVGSQSLSRKDYQHSFPTEGQITKTREAGSATPYASPAKQTKFPESEASKEVKGKRQSKRRKTLADPNTSLKDWKTTRKTFVKAGGKGFGE